MKNTHYPIEDCGVAYALSLIGGKWKLFLLWKLIDSPMRYGELRRALPGISEPVLIVQLKELRQAGVIERIDFQTVPPRVEYRLTEVGRSLHKTLIELDRWGVSQRTNQKVPFDL